MTKSPVLCTKPKSELLQTRLDERSHSGGGSLDFGKQILPGILRRQDQEIAIPTLYPFGRKPPKLAAKGGDVPMVYFRRQTKVLERQDQVVGPEDRFHVSGVGPEAPGRNFAHRVGVLELPQQQFLRASVAVETPDRGRSQLQVGDQRPVVGVPLDGEPALLNLFRLHRLRSTHGHETMLSFPMEGSVGKLACLPAAGEFVIAGIRHPSLQRFVHPRHHMAEPVIFQGLDNLAIVESSVQSHPRAPGSDRRGYLVQDVVEELPRPYGRMNIPGPQLHPQAEATATFAGHQGCVRRLRVASLGNVAPRYALLRPVSHQRRRIGIHDGAVEEAQAVKKFRAKFVVGPLQGAQGLGAKTQQEGAQRIPMGKFFEPQQRGNESVVNQALGVFDAPQTRHDGKDTGQKQVGGMVVPMIVIGPANENLQETANLQTPAKRMKEAEASKASQAAFFEGESEFSGTFGHTSQPYLKGSFVKRPNYTQETRYSYASTATQ